MDESYCLMVLDWGIGGLPLFESLSADFPDADLAYFSDAGYTPYGRVSAVELRARLEQIIDFASSIGAGAVSVACNAMSTIMSSAEDTGPSGVTRLSLIHSWLESETARRLAAPTGPTVLGIAGGYRTIRSALYRRFLEGPLVSCRDIVGQELSRFIEDGDHERIDTLLTKLIGPYRDIEHLILACTHYPAAADNIRALFPNIELIDPVDELYRRSAARIEPRRGRGRRRYMTTGSPQQSARAAQRAFGYGHIPFEALPAQSVPRI